MSLSGNLEELGLGDIMQLISLSRKTGMLSLANGKHEGTIAFKQGQVVRALSSAYRLNLGTVLIQKGAIDTETLNKALTLQKTGGARECLGVILIKHFAVAQDTIEDVVREQIEQIVSSLFTWTEGTFIFEVRENIDVVDGSMVDPLEFMLEQGLNPQFLAMEGTRLYDESRHSPETASNENNSEAHDDLDIAFDLVDAASAGSNPSTARRPLVIVDDDEETLQILTEWLKESGYDVHAMTRGEAALIEIDAICRGGGQPIILIDLIMPKMDGSGVLGGIELLELLHNNFKSTPILMMTDYHHADAEEKIGAMGYRCIKKPQRSECGSQAILQSFQDLLREELQRLKEGM